MEKVYLVIYEKQYNESVKNILMEIGMIKIVFENCLCIKTPYSAKGIYDYLKDHDFDHFVIITEIDKINTQSVFGMHKIELWKFMGIYKGPCD